MSELPPTPVRSLVLAGRRTWEGKLEFRIHDADHGTPEGAVRATQVRVTQMPIEDVLRVEWLGHVVADIDRQQFAAWLRRPDGSARFRAGQTTWLRNGPEDLRVVVAKVEHTVPGRAILELILLAVR